MIKATMLGALVLFAAGGWTQPAAAARAKAAKFTVLSTMLSGMPGAGIGEWGFAGLLEVDGQRLLIDTGARAEAVLRNAEELRIDLSTVTDLVLTHNHADHTGGLLTFGESCRRRIRRRYRECTSRPASS